MFTFGRKTRDADAANIRSRLRPSSHGTAIQHTTASAQRCRRFRSHLIHGDRPDALHDPRFVEPDDVVQPPSSLPLINVVVDVGRRGQKLLRGRTISFQSGVWCENKTVSCRFQCGHHVRHATWAYGPRLPLTLSIWLLTAASCPRYHRTSPPHGTNPTRTTGENSRSTVLHVKDIRTGPG